MKNLNISPSKKHHDFMKYAISLGEKGKCSAAPNPWVGCILVKKGKIVGKGYHSSPGTDHAEKKALLDAGENAEKDWKN